MWTMLADVSWGVFLILSLLIALDALGIVKLDRPARDDGDNGVKFSLTMAGLCNLCLLPVLLVVTVGDSIHGQMAIWKVVAITFVWVVVSYLVFEATPRKIVASAEGLKQARWFQGPKRILWSDVKRVIPACKGWPLTVVASDGTTIEHSRTLADRKRFLQELRRYCGDQLPPEFPGEPLDEVEGMG